MAPIASESSQASPSDLPLKRWTVDEYHQMIALGILTSDTPVELINGQIIERVPQEPPHAATTDEGGDYLKALFVDKAKVRVQLPVTLASDSEPEPDFAIVRIDANRYRASRSDPFRNRHPGPEDIYLVMEVSDSTLRRDREYKAQIYAKAGIPEYWAINLLHNQVIVYRQPQKNGIYASEQTFDAPSKVSPKAFPDIDIDLSQLLILN